MSLDHDNRDYSLFLKQLVVFTQRKRIVEVGVAFGRTTKHLCYAAQETGGHVYGFDLWDTHGLHNQCHAFSSKEEVENKLKNAGCNNFTLTKINTKISNFKDIVKEKVGTIDFAVNGPSDSINSNVINSLTVNNVTAAIGGANPPSTEEVRNMVSFNFAAQKRAVTVNDYKSLIDTMPGRFGAPAKVAITENNNKITIQILSYDQNGKLTQTVSNNLKSNLATYLSKYRMINDYISIDVARVIDLSFDVYVVLESNVNRGQVITEIINQVSNYMAPENRDLGQNVNVSDVRRLIQNTSGVLTLTDLQVFNKVGGQYSTSETSQRYVDPKTRQIQLIDDTIYAEPTQVYQVRFNNKDIKVFVKNLATVDFS